GLADIGVSFGDSVTNAGLVFENDTVQRMAMNVTSHLTLPAKLLDISGSATIRYEAAHNETGAFGETEHIPNQFAIFGAVHISVLNGLFSVDGDLGDAANPGIAIRNGALATFVVHFSTSFSVVGLTAAVDITGSYTSSNQSVTLKGIATVSTPDGTPF